MIYCARNVVSVLCSRARNGEARNGAEEDTSGMRGPTGDEILKTPPPELRVSSKTAQAYLEVRHKILSGEYAAQQVLVPKQIEEAYHINNTTTQMLLMRLANEGLVKVLAIKERTWPNNA